MLTSKNLFCRFERTGKKLIFHVDKQVETSSGRSVIYSVIDFTKVQNHSKRQHVSEDVILFGRKESLYTEAHPFDVK